MGTVLRCEDFEGLPCCPSCHHEENDEDFFCSSYEFTVGSETVDVNLCCSAISTLKRLPRERQQALVSDAFDRRLERLGAE